MANADFEARTNQFVIAMLLACRGDVAAQQDVSVLIGQMMADESAQPIGQSLMRIVVGERNRPSLTEGLSGEPLLLVNRILDELEA